MGHRGTKRERECMCVSVCVRESQHKKRREKHSRHHFQYDRFKDKIVKTYILMASPSAQDQY
jgi:hypothetical protein